MLPPFWSIALTIVGLVSVLVCPEDKLPLHSCLHAIRHWCGHASAEAHMKVHWLLWGVLAWCGLLCGTVGLVWRRRLPLLLLPPSRKLQRAIAQTRLPAHLPVWEAESGMPAGLVGGWRPFIFVARWLVQQLSLPALQAVLRHEYAHWKRGDHRVRWLLFAIAAVFFFVPFVCWLHREWRQACEEAADDWVTEDRKTVSGLLAALKKVAHHGSFVSALGLGSESLERRIQRLRSPRSSLVVPRWASWGFFALSFSLLTGLLSVPPFALTLHCFAEALMK